MATVISLREIVDELEAQFEGSISFLDPDAREITSTNEELRRLAEDDSSDEFLPEWQRKLLTKIREVLASDRCLVLPRPFEIHEWSIMKEFAEEQRSPRIREELLDAIHGSGAFRMFRTSIRRLGIEKAWSQFRKQAFEEIAREWLEKHKLPYR